MRINRVFWMAAAITVANMTAGNMTVATVAQAAGPSQPKVEYSADTMLETADMSMKGKVNFTPTRERREMVMGSGGDKMITITRHDKKVAWTLMPAERMYMEMGLTQAGSGKQPDPSQYQIEQTVIGPETVNGVSTTKSKIIMTGPNGEKMGGFMWMTRENILMKMDAIALDVNQKHRFKTELTNLKVGKQDPKLFEIPPGYEKMSMDMPDMSSMMESGAGEPGADDHPGAGEGATAEEPRKKKRFGLKDALDLIK